MNIGLLGFGVVGGGVWELAQENRALNVKKVLVRREAPSLGKAAVQDVEAIDTDPAALGRRLVGSPAGKCWLTHPRAETFLAERVALLQRVYRR